MPNLNETRIELEKFFIAGWGVTTPIAFDNVKFTETQGVDYVSMYIMPQTTNNTTLGKATRVFGAATFVIKTDINKGTQQAYILADLIGQIMQNKTIVSNLFTFEADTRRSGADKKGWFTLITEVNYTSELIN